MMTRVPAPMEGLLDLMVDKDVEQYVRIQSSIFVMLGKLEDNMHRQTLLNLNRGWCGSVTGRAFKLYCMLAGHFEFPVFSMGRSNQMIVSVRRGSQESITEFVEKYEALWKLGRRPDDRGWRNHYFNTRFTKGPATGWAMISMNRPPEVSIEGLLHTGGWNNIHEVVPKEALLLATSAVLRKEILEIQIHS